MARSRTIPENTYAPGDYGPFSVDNFTNANTDYLEVILTVVNWPTANPLFDLKLTWDNGVSASFVVPWVNGQTDKTGALITQAVFRIAVPQLANGKAAVSGGDISATLHATMTMAITIQAVQGS